MYVNCFKLQKLVTNNVSIEFIYNCFGSNIPKYLPLEHDRYLFCVDHNIDVKHIVAKYNFNEIELYKLKIDPMKYNYYHTIYPSYGPKPYVLFKL